MRKYKVLFGLIASLCFSFGLSQTKNEKEARIEMNAFPEYSKTVISQTPKNAKRQRFYYETDGDKTSYESKFKYNGHWHSVEFNQSGILEDVEIQIKQKEVPIKIFQHIETYFKTHSDKYDIVKIQEQYVFQPQDSLSEFIEDIYYDINKLSPNYEMIVALKKNKSWKLQEVTFDAHGNFIRTRNLVPESYEYIMY
ncbi:hypothetical protein ACU8DI_02525 [Psychroserpens sp. BH13MA-6]